MTLLEWIAVLVLVASLPATFAQEYPELGVKVETVAKNLQVPWSIAWTPDGTVLFTERTGQLRMIQDGTLQKEPLLSLDVGSVEGGLLGVAVDPDYSENGYIYLYYTYNELGKSANKVVRYIHSGTSISKDMTVVDEIPGGPFHDGGRIKFGPDGKLYITTGDAGIQDLSQDINSLGGKILRVNPDGSIPQDNPFEWSPVYSLGHRNPQGLDWDELGNLIITEHGPSEWIDSGHDEINLITPGSNYGWPKVIGNDTQKGLTDPIFHTGYEAWAPSGATFYNSEIIPQWTGKYFVATLRGSHLHMFEFDTESRVIKHQKLFEWEFGRLRDVATGPDGSLYILTSNQDGRGTPQVNDDRILRISPAVAVTSFEECIAAGNQTTASYPRQCQTRDGLYFVETAKEGLCRMVSEEDPILVTTRRDSYSVGDVLLAEGCVDDAGRFDDISVVIWDPEGKTVATKTVVPDQDGIFAEEFVLDQGVFLVNGTYSVTAQADEQYYSTKTVTVPEFGIAVLVFGAGLVTILALQKRLPGRVTI